MPNLDNNRILYRYNYAKEQFLRGRHQDAINIGCLLDGLCQRVYANDLSGYSLWKAKILFLQGISYHETIPRDYIGSLRCFNEIINIPENNIALGQKIEFYHYKAFAFKRIEKIEKAGIASGIPNISDKAKEYLDKVLAEKQTDFEYLSYYYKGVAHYCKKQYESAVYFFTRTIELIQSLIIRFPRLERYTKHDLYEALLNKGLTLIKTGKYDDATSLFRNAVDIINWRMSAKINEGVTYFITERWEDAHKCFDEAIKVLEQEERKGNLSHLHYQYKVLYNNLAKLDMERGELLEAESHFVAIENRFLKEIDSMNDIGDLPLVESKGLLYTKQKKFKSAIELLGRSVYKNQAIIQYRQGVVQYHRKKFDESIECFSNAYRLGQSSNSEVEGPEFDKLAETLNNRGVSYNARKDYDKAEKDFKEAIKIGPSLLVAQENLIRVISGKSIFRNPWDFWSSSSAKTITAILLIAGAILSIAYPLVIGPVIVDKMPPFYSKDFTSESTSFFTEDLNSGGTTNEQNNTDTTRISYPTEIPNSYFYLLGIIVFIILLPSIQQVKVGSFLELTLLQTQTEAKTPLSTA